MRLAVMRTIYPREYLTTAAAAAAAVAGKSQLFSLLNVSSTNHFTEATMEIDVAKGRRDWAFSERDKVVLERESIRTLCDKLRRERDR